jgi:uncharacterized membrane protein HdeD (DUF308 family)
MRKLQGFGALIVGVLLLFNAFDIVNVFGLAIGMTAMIAATLNFFTQLKDRRFSINSILVGAFGVALVLNRETALQSLMQLIAFLVIGIGLSNMIQYRRRRVTEENIRFIGGAVTIIVGLILLVFPGFPFTLLRIILALLLIGFGFFRLNAKVVSFNSYTWNETVFRSMGKQVSDRPDVIDVEAEETTTKK